MNQLYYLLDDHKGQELSLFSLVDLDHTGSSTATRVATAISGTEERSRTYE